MKKWTVDRQFLFLAYISTPADFVPATILDEGQTSRDKRASKKLTVSTLNAALLKTIIEDIVIVIIAPKRYCS